MLARTVQRAATASTSSRAAFALHTSTPLPPPAATLPPLLPASARLPLPTSTPSALAQIAQTPKAERYVIARLHSRTYLLHPKDILTVPNLRERPEPGTVLALTRILEAGGREYAIKSEDREPLGNEVVRCSLTVLEHTKSPLTRTLLKKRRKGYERTVENKQGWTRFRVGDVLLADE